MPGEKPPVVSEDCLYLNLWTPVKSATQRLPVIVWIYGGGWINGSASMPLYWGDRLAQKGVVVVTIAYRLGPAQDLSKSGTLATTLNQMEAGISATNAAIELRLASTILLTAAGTLSREKHGYWNRRGSFQ